MGSHVDRNSSSLMKHDVTTGSQSAGFFCDIVVSWLRSCELPDKALMLYEDLRSRGTALTMAIYNPLLKALCESFQFWPGCAVQCTVSHFMQG